MRLRLSREGSAAAVAVADAVAVWEELEQIGFGCWTIWWNFRDGERLGHGAYVWTCVANAVFTS